jgi:hypothetical protein
MELLPILRLIWRRRLLLGAGLVVSLALALGIGGPPPSSSALAWTRVNLDTPTSQLVNAAPGGADTLPWRASLLVHLMATDATQRQLAQRLHVRPDEVVVDDTALKLPIVPASIPAAAAEAAQVTRAPYVLTIALTNPMLPTIAIEAAAPEGAGAKRLAAAGVAILESQASLSDARYSSKILTGGGFALKRQPFVVHQVAPIRAKPVTQRVISPKQIGPPLFLLALWTAAALLLPGGRLSAGAGRVNPPRPRRRAPAA